MVFKFEGRDGFNFRGQIAHQIIGFGDAANEQNFGVHVQITGQKILRTFGKNNAAEVRLSVIKVAKIQSLIRIKIYFIYKLLFINILYFKRTFRDDNNICPSVADTPISQATSGKQKVTSEWVAKLREHDVQIRFYRQMLEGIVEQNCLGFLRSVENLRDCVSPFFAHGYGY